MKITKDKIIYDAEDWLGGFDTLRSGQDQRTYGPGLALTDAVDPFRNYGYIQPGFAPTAATTSSSITDALRNGVVDTTSAFALGSTLVHKITGIETGTPAINTTSPFPHTIDHGHASEAGQDCVIYYTGTTKRMFFSFNDATDWDVGIYNFVADTFDDDFMTTVPTNPLADNWGGVATADYLTQGAGFPHPLIVGADDIMYMGDRNFVHAYDGQTGATGTFYGAVLTLPVGFVITSFAKTKDLKLAIFGYRPSSPTAGATTYYRSEAKAYFWPYLGLDPDYELDLHDNYVSEAFNWNGTIACFTDGPQMMKGSGSAKLQALVNGEFVTLQTYSGSLPIRGGVEVVGDDIYWNGSGKIYGYQKVPYTADFVFNHVMTGTGTTSGMLKLFVGTLRLFVSSGATTSGGLELFSGNYVTDARCFGKLATPEWPERKRGRLKSATITLFDTVSGGRSLKLDTALFGDTYAVVELLAATTAFTTTQKIVFDRSDGTNALGDFEKLQPRLTWATGSAATAAPVVQKVEYEYELINIP